LLFLCPNPVDENASGLLLVAVKPVDGRDGSEKAAAFVVDGGREIGPWAFASSLFAASLPQRHTKI